MNTAIVLGFLLAVSLPKAQSWSLGLELEIDTSLRKDSEFPAERNSGAYLKDSFRRDVLVPSLSRMVAEIERNGKNDAEIEISILVMMGTLALVCSYFIFKLKMELKEMSRKQSAKSDVQKDCIKLVPTSEVKLDKGSFKMEFPGA